MEKGSDVGRRVSWENIVKGTGKEGGSGIKWKKQAIHVGVEKDADAGFGLEENRRLQVFRNG